MSKQPVRCPACGLFTFVQDGPCPACDPAYDDGPKPITSLEWKVVSLQAFEEKRAAAGVAGNEAQRARQRIWGQRWLDGRRPRAAQHGLESIQEKKEVRRA